MVGLSQALSLARTWSPLRVSIESSVTEDGPRLSSLLPTYLSDNRQRMDRVCGEIGELPFVVRIIRGEASGVGAKNVIVNPNCKYRACVPCLFNVAKNQIWCYNGLNTHGRVRVISN